ncbi:MAG: carboxypeptidase regulatory-like domain-containing protein [Acidobacteriota bacterium]
MQRRIFHFLVPAFFCIAFTLLAQAQTNTGTLTGEVNDTNKAVVSGARVRATNLATNITLEVTTSGAGVFSVASLQPGTYRVTVEAAGFKTAVIEPVEVLTASTASIKIALEIGQTTETVQVVAESALLSQDSAAVSTTIENELIKELPFPERSALGAVMISAGVTGDPQYPGGVQSEVPGLFLNFAIPGGATQMGGGRPGTGSVLVDGSDNSLASLGRTGVTFSGDTIKEVTVQVTGVPAQYGRTGGGIINQSSKGGGSDFHGGLFWQHTDPGMQAWTHGTHEINRGPQKRQNYYSGFVGGPISLPKKFFGPLAYNEDGKKSFFFVSVEPSRYLDQFYTANRVLTPKELTGDLSESLELINQCCAATLQAQGVEAALAQLRGLYAQGRGPQLYYQFPTNANGFPLGAQYANNTLYQPIPGNNLSRQLAQNRLAQEIFKLYPTPSNPGPFTVFIRPDGLWDRTGVNAFTARGVKSVDNRYSFRIDHQISANDRANFRYTYVPVTGTRFNFLGFASPANPIAQDDNKSRNFIFSETHIFGGTKVNEFRASYTRGTQFRGPNELALSKDWGAELGLLPATLGVGYPAIGGLPAPNGIGSGGGTGLVLDTNLGFADDFSMLKGRHALKFGADVRFFQANRLDATGAFGGSYTFSGFTNGPATPGVAGPSVGGSNVASFILGIMSNVTVRRVQIPFYYRWKYYAGYFQDDFKVRPNLTLNLGVRYDVETPRVEKYNRQGSFDPNVTGTLNGRPVTGGFVFAGENGRPRGLWGTNFKGVQPRFGFAWTPKDFMTVRGSYSILRPGLTGLGNFIIPDLGVPNTTIGGVNGGVNAGIVNYITNPVGPIPAPAAQSGGPLFTANFAVPYIDPSDTFPYVQQWSLALQFKLTRSTVLETSYNGSRGTHLFGVQRDINLPSYDTLMQKVKEGANLATQTPNPFGLTDAAGRVRTMNGFQTLRPFLQFFDQQIASIWDRNGNSIYHGLYVSLLHRFSKRLYFQGSYTWQKSIDDVSQSSNSAEAAIFGTARAQNLTNLKAERAESTYNVPHKITFGYTWDLPVGKGRLLDFKNGFLNNVIGGWKTSALSTIQAGYPVFVRLGSVGYFFSTGGGNALEGATTLRPNVIAGVPLTNNDWHSDPYGNNQNKRLINPAAFSVPGSLGNPAFGNAARTLSDLRNPWTEYFDANVSKRIPLHGDRVALELRGDILGTFNHPNFFINPNNAHDFANAYNATTGFVVRSDFGKFDRNNTTGARLIRVGIKLVF